MPSARPCARIHNVALRLAGVSGRVKWAFVDQALVSAGNLLFGIVMARYLGLHDFGVFTLIYMWIQLLAAVQTAGILAPMMSLFDQRGDVPRGAYLAVVLLHQAAFLAFLAFGWMLWSHLPEGLLARPNPPVGSVILAAVVFATQFQDLLRRFFYVTDRPALAFASDVIAYGARLPLVFVLGVSGELSLTLAFWAIVGTSMLAMVLGIADVRTLTLSRRFIKTITQRHASISGWMVGAALAQWFSASYYFVVIGSVLGAEALGGVRAVQNLIAVLNVALQALENFVPSTAARVLVSGGREALRSYLNKVSIIGGSGIVAGTLCLLIVLGPVMELVYGQTFAGQGYILVVFGVYFLFAHGVSTVSAGLRALAETRSLFWVQAIVATASLALSYPMVERWEIFGALVGLLAGRMIVFGYAAMSLRGVLK